MARLIDAFTQYFDNAGDPLANGFIRFLESGTTNTDKDTFADINETIPNANPVELDGAGRVPNVFGSGSYRAILFTSDMVQIGQFDPIGSSVSGAFSDWNSQQSYFIDEIVTYEGEYYRSLINNNENNTPSSSQSSWELLQLGRQWNPTIQYSNTDSVYGSNGQLYFSSENSNLNNDPTTDTTGKWILANQNPYSAGSGTGDAIAASYSPSLVINNGLQVRVSAPGANTIAAPTIAIDGGGAKTIVKTGNQALLAGDIFGSGHELLLVYSSTNDNWELLNPAIVPGLSNRIASAWVNFEGIGVVSIRDSYNVGSITDNGNGDYTINYINNLDNSDYSVWVSSNITSSSGANNELFSTATSNHRIKIKSGATPVDTSLITTGVFGGVS